MKKKMKMGLCQGRHEIPAVEEYIFPQELNPLDTEGLEQQALNVLAEKDVKELDLYVTGLTVALIAVINACRQMGVKVTLYHYDRESNGYYPQRVV